MELLDFHGEHSLISILVLLLQNIHHFVKLRIFLRTFLIILLLDAKQLQNLRMVHLEPQEIFSILRLIIPSRHLKSKALVIDFYHFSHQVLETFLQLQNVRLSSDKSPLAELQTYLLEVQVTQLTDKVQHGLELLHGAVIEMRGMEPEALNVLFSIFNDVLCYLFEHLALRQVESCQIDFQHFDGFARS